MIDMIRLSQMVKSLLIRFHRPIVILMCRLLGNTNQRYGSSVCSGSPEFISECKIAFSRLLEYDPSLSAQILNTSWLIYGSGITTMTYLDGKVFGISERWLELRSTGILICIVYAQFQLIHKSQMSQYIQLEAKKSMVDWLRQRHFSEELIRPFVEL